MTETLALTVHGPFGAIDMLVPSAARLADVSREYARQTQSQIAPQLHRLNGEELTAQSTVHRAGLRPGAVLVAGYGDLPTLPRPPGATTSTESPPAANTEERVSPLPFVMAGIFAALAGWLAASTDSQRLFDSTLALLGAAALIGVLPLGRCQELRAAVAPVFGAATAFALIQDPAPEMLPLTIGITALAAAVVAGIGRALGSGSAIVHSVWMVSGSSVFVIVGASVLAGFDSRLIWSTLVLVAVLAARSAAGMAVDVPDQMLLDLERLAVTAWSARDKPRGRRARMTIDEAGVSELLARGSTIVNAAAAAILVVTVLAVPNLFSTATYDIDRAGARILAFFAGAALMLAARSYRHTPARAMLRTAGLFAWAVLAQELLAGAPERFLIYAVALSLFLALGLLIAAIATGRGWRSVKWARRAEIGEMLAGAFTVAAVVVSSGLFRQVWELPFGG